MFRVAQPLPNPLDGSPRGDKATIWSEVQIIWTSVQTEDAWKDVRGPHGSDAAPTSAKTNPM